MSRLLLIPVSPVLALATYYGFFHVTLEECGVERAAVSMTADTVDVALVWPGATQDNAGTFVRGAQLAADEINATGGVIASDGVQRPLRIELFDDPGNNGKRWPSTGAGVAGKIAFRPEFLAAVGHQRQSTIQASIIYERSATLFLAPTGDNHTLANARFRHVFRMAPEFRHVAEAMIDTVHTIKLHRRIRLAVFCPRATGSVPHSQVSSELTTQAQAVAESYGGRISFLVDSVHHFDSSRRDHGTIVKSTIRSLEQVDAVLIADTSNPAGHLRQQIRDKWFVQFGREMTPPVVHLDSSARALASGLHADENRAERENCYRTALSQIARQTKHSLAILTPRSRLGRKLRSGLRLSVEQNAHDPVSGLNIAVDISYDSRGSNEAAIIAELRSQRIDFVLLGGDGPDTVKLIDGLRRSGFDHPVICSPGLESSLMPTTVDGTIKHPRPEVYVISTFDRTQKRASRFISSYQQANEGRLPDADAAYAYSAIHLIDTSVGRATGFRPLEVASAMRLLTDQDCVLGSNRFSLHGHLVGHEFVAIFAGEDGSMDQLTPANPAHGNWGQP